MSKHTYHALRLTYQRLLKAYGWQDWWPADHYFEIMIGAILTQNTNWTNVEKAIANLKHNHCLNPAAILALTTPSLAQYIRPSGYYNQKAKRLKLFCEWYLASGGFNKLNELTTPVLRESLLNLHGIGPESADDILLYAFKRPVFVIDAYTMRLVQRLGIYPDKLAYAHLQAHFHRALAADTQVYSQYHALIVVHAKMACKKQPLCTQCPLSKHCPYPKLQPPP
jgi:endonuclease III related protein